MARGKKGLNLSMSGKTAAYAGKQWQLEHQASPYRQIIHDEITRLMFSRYKYYGPTEQEARELEYQLLTAGVVGIVRGRFDATTRQPDGVYIGPISFTDAEMDFYGQPMSATVKGRNGKEIVASSQDDFVIGYCTKASYNLATLVTPDIVYIDSYVDMIDNALQMWMVAAETRKCGTVFRVPNQRIAKFVQDVLARISMNMPYVVITGSLGEVQDEPIFAPQNTDALADYHDNLVNTISWVLDALGLENQPQNKQERLVVTEAMNNRNLSRYIGADGLAARKSMCDELREKGIADWRVEFYLDSVGQESMNEAGEEGDANDVSGMGGGDRQKPMV